MLVRVTTSEDLPRTLGEIIRHQRELAELPLRQLARMVGISNPYLSQIENGLRDPSEQVLSGIAASLGLSPGDLRKGPPSQDGAVVDVLEAIRIDPRLTPRQRKALIEVYDAMITANGVGEN
jgi:transcriptional regulator with XRE-family HTH domain